MQTERDLMLRPVTEAERLDTVRLFLSQHRPDGTVGYRDVTGVWDDVLAFLDRLTDPVTRDPRRDLIATAQRLMAEMVLAEDRWLDTPAYTGEGFDPDVDGFDAPDWDVRDDESDRYMY